MDNNKELRDKIQDISSKIDHFEELIRLPTDREHQKQLQFTLMRLYRRYRYLTEQLIQGNC